MENHIPAFTNFWKIKCTFPFFYCIHTKRQRLEQDSNATNRFQNIQFTKNGAHLKNTDGSVNATLDSSGYKWTQCLSVSMTKIFRACSNQSSIFSRYKFACLKNIQHNHTSFRHLVVSDHHTLNHNTKCRFILLF